MPQASTAARRATALRHFLTPTASDPSAALAEAVAAASFVAVHAHERGRCHRRNGHRAGPAPSMRRCVSVAPNDNRAGACAPALLALAVRIRRFAYMVRKFTPTMMRRPAYA